MSLEPQADRASLQHSAPIMEKSGELPPHTMDAYASSSSNRNPDQQRINELERAIGTQVGRINELETALREARKIIDTRERLLNSLQWDPKEDFYSYQNPKVSDKVVKDALAGKLKVLIEQMKVMEVTLEEKDKKLSASLVMSQSLRQSGMVTREATREASQAGGLYVASPSMASPAIRGSPKMNGSKSPKTPKTPKWSASGVASPVLGSPARPKKSGSWWFGGGRKNSIIGESSMGSSVASPSMAQSSRAKSSMVV